MTSTPLTTSFKVLAFDADDTLWDCQGHFEQVMQHLYDELLPWVDRQTATAELFATERKNMPMLGFGVKAFTLSMLETAMRVSQQQTSIHPANHPAAVLRTALLSHHSPTWRSRDAATPA